MVEDLEDLRAFIASRVREGFESVHGIIEDAAEYAFEKHKRDNLHPEIKRMTAELIAIHQVDQASWEEHTDCDRLDEAFAALNRQGIVARQNFSCCNNCGFTEIWDEIEEEEKRQPVEGYVFYHLQATETAIASGQLLMAYGCVEEDKAAFVRVAKKVVAELRRAGLNASWGGTVYHPIVVEGIVWRRRR
ncbi:MAG TPA: hypothetical protein VMF69_11400 [Gemmataceae bacterium]|nr:hypothetical protein [Gemmataceae bacterium]